MRNSYKILVRKPEGKRPLGRPRHRCEVNISIDLTETVWEGVEWINLAKYTYQWRALVYMIMCQQGFRTQIRQINAHCHLESNVKPHLSLAPSPVAGFASL
jgi:hypothetical protein